MNEGAKNYTYEIGMSIEVLLRGYVGLRVEILNV
jgi:hypothetical protein